MIDLYTMIGVSKQAHYKRVKLLENLTKIEAQILNKAVDIRSDHSRMGCRKLYTKIAPQGYGRDKTEKLLLDNGFRVFRKRNYMRTTHSGLNHYQNLISGMCVKDINQLWVSDITYIPISHNKYCYLTLIQDVYSRLIVGWSLSDNMLSEQTVERAYKKAIRSRKCDLKGLIFHSDRGSQYSSRIVRKIHNKYQIKPSMGNKAWENAHAESLNGVLKNEYINFKGVNPDLKKAQKYMEKWINLYNKKRPHGSLNNQTPEKFETFLQGLPIEEKPIVKINY